MNAYVPTRTLQEAFKSQDFALTAKLSMAHDQNAHDLVAEAHGLSNCVDAIQIPDNIYARSHISNIAAAALIIQERIDPIVHMNCRDRNRIAAHSDLLGAQALGVTNILLMRGSNLPADHLPRTTNVHDMDTITFIRAAAAIRDNEIPANEKRPDAPQLHIGTVATAFRPVEDWQPEKLLAKVDAGAQFVQLQVCMNAGVIKKYVAKLVAAKITWRIQILAGLAVFPSADAARQLRKNGADVLIPRTVIDRLEQSKDAEREGIRICAEILAELAETPGIAGANLMTAGAVGSVAAAVMESGVRPGD